MISQFFEFGIPGLLLNKAIISPTVHMILMVVGVLITIVSSYLLGSLNFAIIISKRFYHSDIRNYGSGNAGMTNMMRTFGKSAAGFTLLGDALKAFVSCLIGYATMGTIGAYIGGLFCIMGHMFPIFYKFKGGKGVVTAAITILMCNPFVFLILFGLFVIIVAGTKFISLGSIVCVMLFPILLNRMDVLFNGTPGMHHVIAILISALIVFMHRENIKRLYHGKENKFSFKKSTKIGRAHV